jgi:glycosyltransferase involved in cell wall biosynthesis
VPAATLVVAGSGDERFVRTLKAQAQSLDIESDILWVGFLTGDEKQAALADADVFVLPSYSENFGIAAAEAMAAGAPVIVSDQVGIHHDIAEAAAGLVVTCDEAPLTRALIILLDDPRLRRSMGRSGRELVEKRYSPAAIAGDVLSLYEGITS